jgi:ArsR family metal-binding transcriptional regulator
MIDFLIAMAEKAAAEAAAAMSDPIASAMASGTDGSPSINKQMQPAMDAYKVMVNPQSTAGDMGRAAFQYSANTSSDPETALPQAPQGFNPYSYMSNNSIQGIPSILQNSNSGILPFITGR